MKGKSRFMKTLKSIVTAWLLAAVSLCLGLAFLVITSVYADTPPESQQTPSTIPGSDPPTGDVSAQDANPPTFPPNPLITPTNGITITNPRATFEWAAADDPDGVISYTLLVTGSDAFTGLSGQAATATVTTTNTAYTPTQVLPNGVYTWTVRAHDTDGNASGYVTPTTFTLAATWRQVYLPVVLRPESSGCPDISLASFNLIPIDGPRTDHPDYLHGDLNLALRGYAAISAALELVDYKGSVDSDAPQLAGLFGPNRLPGLSAVYQVNNWNWGCGTHGCPGPAITDPEVTLASMVTTPGEAIYIPERDSKIYGGDYKAMVLYAEEKRITFGYTSQDTVAPGYAVHIENVCVDPNLLALYRAQTDSEGWHNTGYLPALRNDEALGTAFGSQIQVAIRDKGTFMDPRSRKDWWWGY